MKKRKKILSAVIIIILISIVLGILFITNVKSSIQNVEVCHGADLKDIVLVSVSGEEEYFNEDCFVFYMSDTCSPCIEKLELIERLSQLKCLQQINIYCVWKDEMPKEAQEGDIVTNLSLKGKYKFCDFFPFYFCYEGGKVSFMTEDYHKLIKKIMEKADENKVKMDLFYTLLKQSDIEHTCIIFVAGNDNHFDDYKKIQTNGITFTNIIQVKDYRDGIGIYDEFDLYKTVFDITDYPSVLYYDGELKVEAMEGLQ